MNAIERFRQRQNRAAVLTVPWPGPDKPEILFKVQRFSQVEPNAARRDAEALMRQAGYDLKEMDADEFAKLFPFEYCEALAKYVKRHVKGWEHIPPEGQEPIKFTVGNLEALFSQMTPSELRDLSASYLMSADAEEKKSMNSGNSETDLSSNSSSD